MSLLPRLSLSALCGVLTAASLLSAGPAPAPLAAARVAPAPPAAQATPAPGASRVLYEADWSNGVAGWTGTEDWSTLNGTLVKRGTATWDSTFAPPFQPATDDYIVQAELELLDNQGGMAITVRGSQFGEYKLGVYEGQAIITAADPFSPLARAPFDPVGAWHTYRVEARGDTLRLLIDGRVVLEHQDTQFLTGRQIGLWATRSEGSVRNFRVLAP